MQREARRLNFAEQPVPNPQKQGVPHLQVHPRTAGTVVPQAGGTAAHSLSCNGVLCSRGTWEHLGVCDNQVPGDLKSSDEGAQLDLLVGANRESVLDVCHFSQQVYSN